MPFGRRARQVAFGYLPCKPDNRCTSLWRNDTRKVLLEAVTGVAKMPKVRSTLCSLIIRRQKSGGIGPLREYNAECERALAAGFGDASLPPVYSGNTDGEDGDWDIELVNDDDFIKFVMDNWQIIAEDQHLFEVELMAGLTGANIDTLERNYKRRMKPKERRKKRFYECDELRAVLKTGDQRRIQVVREKHREKREKQQKGRS